MLQRFIAETIIMFSCLCDVTNSETKGQMYFSYNSLLASRVHILYNLDQYFFAYLILVKQSLLAAQYLG